MGPSFRSVIVAAHEVGSATVLEADVGQDSP